MSLACAALLLLAPALPTASAPARPFKADPHTLLLAHYDARVDADRAAASPRAHGRAPFVKGRFGRGVHAAKGWLTPEMSLLDIEAFPRFVPITYSRSSVNPRRGCLEMHVRFEKVKHPEYFRRVMTWEAGASYVLFALRPLPKSRTLNLQVKTPKGGATLTTPFPYAWDGQWRHIGMQWTDKTYSLVVDGKVVATARAPIAGLPAPKTRVSIGAHARGVNVAEAVIDEVRISDIPRYAD